MARDGSGNYSRVEGPYINGTVADADEINAELDDITTALSDSINRNGTKAFAADQSMGGNQLTDVGDPSANTDAANKQHVAAAVAALSTVYQPLDATLTAIAALSWSSGSPVIQFTAADTVSLTLSPTLTSVLVGDGTVSLPAVRFASDPDNGFYIAGTNTVRYAAGGALQFQLYPGAIDLAVSGGQYLAPNGTATVPPFACRNDANTGMFFDGADGLSLTTGGTARLTLSTTLAEWVVGVAGRFAQVTGVGGETLVAATHRNRQLILDGDITLPDATFAVGDWHVLIGDGSARTITRGSGVTMYVNGTNSATATLPARGKAGVQWETASVVHISGDAY